MSGGVENIIPLQDAANANAAAAQAADCWTCKYGCTLWETAHRCPDHGAVKGLRAVMPNGTGCYYVDPDHSYWRMRPDNGKRGTRLTGTTTVCKVYETDYDGLLRWAARTNGIGIAMLAAPIIERLRAGEPVDADALAWLESAEAIWAELERRGLTYDDVRDARGTVGTNVHERAFQALAAGRAVPDLDGLTVEERGYADGVMAFWLDHEPEASLVEAILVSMQLGVAGRVDFIGRLLSRCGDDTCPCQDIDPDDPGVLDAKTGKYLGNKEHVQVQGYRRLADHAGHGDTGWAALLQLRPDGTYQLVRSTATLDDFDLAVAAYRAAGRIGREAGRERKARQ
jgi:hypothetical protein